MSDAAPFLELIKGSIDLGFKVVGSIKKVDDMPDDIPEDVPDNSQGNLDTNEISGDMNFEEDVEMSADATTEGENLTFSEDSDNINESPYDFNGVDCFADTERMDSLLDDFQDGKWDSLSLDDKKQSMEGLAEYVIDVTGNESPPDIVFRSDMGEGEYGGYNPETNTLEINENMLDDSNEAADTVAHELWHAYQEQCASDPASEKGQEYREGFDNYISPEYDFEGYQDQMVESEARAFAQNFKDRLSQIKGGNA